MKDLINIREDDLHEELHKFDNKDVRVIFFGNVNGRIKLNHIKTKVENFEVFITSKTTKDNLIFDLCDIYNIQRSVKDSRKLYLHLESIGAVAIVG